MQLFNDSQTLVLLSAMLAIDMVDLVLLTRGPATWLSLITMMFVCCFVVGDAYIAWHLATSGTKSTLGAALNVMQ